MENCFEFDCKRSLHSICEACSPPRPYCEYHEDLHFEKESHIPTKIKFIQIREEQKRQKEKSILEKQKLRTNSKMEIESRLLSSSYGMIKEIKQKTNEMIYMINQNSEPANSAVSPYKINIKEAEIELILKEIEGLFRVYDPQEELIRTEKMERFNREENERTQKQEAERRRAEELEKYRKEEEDRNMIEKNEEYVRGFIEEHKLNGKRNPVTPCLDKDPSPATNKHSEIRKFEKVFHLTLSADEKQWIDDITITKDGRYYLICNR